MVESNELIKKNFNTYIDSLGHEEQKIFNEFIRKNSSELRNSENRINRDTLVHKYKAEKKEVLKPLEIIKTR